MIYNLFSMLSTPVLLGHFVINALLGSLAFAIAIKYCQTKNFKGRALKYMYSFIAINFIVRCFIVLMYPGYFLATPMIPQIAWAAIILIPLGALLNVCHFHISDKVAIRYKNKS